VTHAANKLNATITRTQATSHQQPPVVKQPPTIQTKQTSANTFCTTPQPRMLNSHARSLTFKQPAPNQQTPKRPPHKQPQRKAHITAKPLTYTSSEHSFPTCFERSPANYLLRPALASRPRTQGLCLTKALTSSPGGCPLPPWLGAGCVVGQQSHTNITSNNCLNM